MASMQRHSGTHRQWRHWQPTEDSHETHLHPASPAKWQMVGPARQFVGRPSGSDGAEQGRSADDDAKRVAIPDRIVPVQRRVGAYGGASSAGRRQNMNDDTRRLLKVFGVAVTDAEAEAAR